MKPHHPWLFWCCPQTTLLLNHSTGVKSGNWRGSFATFRPVHSSPEGFRSESCVNISLSSLLVSFKPDKLLHLTLASWLGRSYWLQTVVLENAPQCGFGVSFWFHSDFASLAGIAQKGGWVLRFVCCQTVDNFNLSRYHWCSLSSLDSGGFCQASPLWSLYQSVYRGEVLGNSVDVSVRLSVYSSVCQYRLTVPHFG